MTLHKRLVQLESRAASSRPRQWFAAVTPEEAERTYRELMNRGEPDPETVAEWAGLSAEEATWRYIELMRGP